MQALDSGRPLGVPLDEALASCDWFGKSNYVAAIVDCIADASVTISDWLRGAQLTQSLETTHDRNVFGDEVRELDVRANRLLCDALRRTRRCAAVASEELPEPLIFGGSAPCAVVLDPLDGSSNLDPGLTLGTIFGVFDKPPSMCPEAALLQCGRELVAAGYVLYGSRVTLVVANPDRAVCFDLDEAARVFRMTSPSLRCPASGAIYSVNEANVGEWGAGLQAWLAERRQRSPDGQRAKLRYTGALVADAHRTLLQGGVFAYPGTRRAPHGKLRLLYEANPMAFVFEAAGAAASTGQGSPLDCKPRVFDQRSPLILGSVTEVHEFERSARPAWSVHCAPDDPALGNATCSGTGSARIGDGASAAPGKP